MEGCCMGGGLGSNDVLVLFGRRQLRGVVIAVFVLIGPSCRVKEIRELW